MTKPSKTTEHRAEASDTATAMHEKAVIPVVQEELDVRKRRVETGGGARVVKTVEEREALVDEALLREEVDVERVPVNRAVDAPVAVRYEGDTMIVPVLEEVLVVEKRLMLKEEIRITRRKSEFRQPQRVMLRREHAAVERVEDSTLQGTPAMHPSNRSEAQTAESLLEKKRQQAEELRRQVSSPAHEKKGGEP
ncbi:MAG: YsnF/AvaK domain-containing protein [Rhodospirillaceae bacterium]